VQQSTLHVIRSDLAETSESFMTRMKKEAEEYLNKVKVNADEKKVQIKTEIISSINIAGGILDYAEENNIDLIVIGTRGRSGFKRLLLGSVASHVVTYAHCPVFVAK
jgi:nucleotide-binding universal stress UspA family protein